MANWARKIIEAVQNSMLDTLLLSLSRVWWIGWAWDSRQNDLSSSGLASVVAIMLALFAIAWVLGAIANRRPKARDRTHRNGFEAWLEPPAGGLRPPLWLRSAVMALGREPPLSALIGFAGYTLYVTASGLLLILALRPDSSWIVIPERLVSGANGDFLWLAAAATVAAFVIRQWAVQQRDRLVFEKPVPLSSGSDWAGFGVLSVFVFAIVVVPAAIFDWPKWILAGPVFALIAIAVLPRLRRGMFDQVLGKRQKHPA